eukprot:TRINITY_DN4259_c0_g1_i3.p1 TRINITY_DN4259_c0_g1~~TRINITY_DN4259_c0_g1_i3.p1  ORF type:complete len:188 (-),score=18.92 TRINITY_DN4259_c0_g1_i3:104-625(-)
MTTATATHAAPPPMTPTTTYAAAPAVNMATATYAAAPAVNMATATYAAAPAVTRGTATYATAPAMNTVTAKYAGSRASYARAKPVLNQTSLFDQLDTNHDGVITREEMTRAANVSTSSRREISTGYGFARGGMPLSTTAYVGGRPAAISGRSTSVSRNYARGGTVSSSPVAVV